MIKLIQNPSVYTIKNIIEHPVMVELHSGIKNYAYNWTPDPETSYILGVDVASGKQIGLVTFKPFTDLILEAHIYILPEHWGTGMSGKFAAKVYQDIFVPSKYAQLMTYTPATCVQVESFLTNFGFTKEYTMHKALTYMNQLTDLHFYIKNKETS